MVCARIMKELLIMIIVIEFKFLNLTCHPALHPLHPSIPTLVTSLDHKKGLGYYSSVVKCVHMPTCTQWHLAHTCSRVHTCTHTDVHEHTVTCTHTHTQMYIHITYSLMCMRIHWYTHTHTDVHVYTATHTRIH